MKSILLIEVTDGAKLTNADDNSLNVRYKRVNELRFGIRKSFKDESVQGNLGSQVSPRDVHPVVFDDFLTFCIGGYRVGCDHVRVSEDREHLLMVEMIVAPCNLEIEK